MFEETGLRAEHPVTGVSWFEAEAYARFAGKRLPTEAEWEKAASWDESAGVKRRYAWGDSAPTSELCNSGLSFWGTTPAGSFPDGASAYGCQDMTGNVWEWTSTPFDAFPGFEPFPYPEYSEVLVRRRPPCPQRRLVGHGTTLCSAPRSATSFAATSASPSPASASPPTPEFADNVVAARSLHAASGLKG